MTEPDYCCQAIIIRLNRRCKNLPSSGGCYCNHHGPLCHALTLNGVPCNSMVLKFREGFIYCAKHENVSLERYIGQHPPTKCHPTDLPKKTKAEERVQTSNAYLSSTIEPRTTTSNTTTTTTTITTTITKTTNVTTTTTTTTTTTEELGELFEWLGLSGMSSANKKQ